jgi:phosphatidylserine synthase
MTPLLVVLTEPHRPDRAPRRDEESDLHVFGVTVAARNARVARRAGAAIVPIDALASEPSRPALLLPAHVLIDHSLIALARSVTTATWLQASDGAAALAGPAQALRTHAQRHGGRELPRRYVPAHALVDVSSPPGRRRAAWRVLQGTAKATDGWVSRRLNRPISRLISFVLLSLGCRPVHASTLTLLVGLLAAGLATSPGPLSLIATGVLFHLASILDGVDGEMARATFTESDAGARLDTLVDQITYVACFAGVTIGWVREGAGAEALWLTGAVAMALLVTLVRGGRFLSRHAPNASFVFIDRSVRRAAVVSGRVGLQIAARLFTFLRRDLFAIVFLMVSLWGRRALIPALVALGGVVANITFSRYREELAHAAAAERLAAGCAPGSAA